MSDTIISVESLSKRYIIGHQRDASDGLRHRLEDAFRHPFRRLRSLLRAPSSLLSALCPLLLALSNLPFFVRLDAPCCV